MLKTIELKNIKPNPFNARIDYEDEPIALLAKEIEEAGFWSGALRGRLKNGKVELCFGHRRLEALKKLGYKEIKVDIVPLTDDEMSWQGLAENLQRQGLNDMEKAEGIKKLVAQTVAQNNCSDDKATEIVAKRLGYKHGSAIRMYLPIADLPKSSKKAVRERKISGRAATVAFKLGGDEMVKTATEEGLSQHTLEKLSQELEKIPDEKIRERLKDKVISGEILDPKELAKKAEPMVRAKKEKKEPPDMMVIIAMWTDDIDAWMERLDQMLPYRSQMNRVPAIADKFRKKANQFIVRLQKLIAEDERVERTVN